MTDRPRCNARPIDLDAIRRSVAGMSGGPPVFVTALVGEVERLRATLAAERTKRERLEGVLVGLVVGYALRGLRLRGAA